MPEAKKVALPVFSKNMQISGHQLVAPHQALAVAFANPTWAHVTKLPMTILNRQFSIL
jgi:hypothetical protein